MAIAFNDGVIHIAFAPVVSSVPTKEQIFVAKHGTTWSFELFERFCAEVIKPLVVTYYNRVTKDLHILDGDLAHINVYLLQCGIYIDTMEYWGPIGDYAKFVMRRIADSRYPGEYVWLVQTEGIMIYKIDVLGRR